MSLPVAVTVALVAEVVLGGRFAVAGARPEILLIAACLAALFPPKHADGVVVAWCVGLAKDLATANPPGVYALLFGLMAWVLVSMKRNVPLTSFTGFAAAVFCGSLVVAASTWVFAGPVAWTRVVFVSLKVAAYTAVVGAVAFGIHRAWVRRGLRRRRA